MKIAVVGAGLFGSTAAIRLARGGHEVHLYDPEPRPLNRASGINMGRLHRGYHYPRSSETVAECQRGYASFMAEYGEAVDETGVHVYAIAAEGSKTSERKYRSFLRNHLLPYEEYFSAHPRHPAFPWLAPGKTSLAIKGLEARVDPDRLRALVTERLQAAGVACLFGGMFFEFGDEGYDRYVVATYANTNDVLAQLGAQPAKYQFELCEVPIVRISDFPRNMSIVVLDGEFGGIDPYGCDGLHVLSHVRHMVHERRVGTTPAGIIAREPTRIARFIDALAEYVPAVRGAEHIESRWVVRTVLPDVDDTDERPTLVDELPGGVIRILGGKLGTCVDTADAVSTAIEQPVAEVA